MKAMNLSQNQGYGWNLLGLMMENTANLSKTAFESDKIVMKQGLVYILLAALGVAVNLGVLIRLMRVCLKQSDQFFDGCAMPLSVMALSDLLSLISIIILVSTTMSLKMQSATVSWIFSAVIKVKCKGTMFLLHTMTGVSKWCWLFLSTLRFLAVYHPLWHRRQWRLGNRCVPLIFIISVVVNIWLIWAVTSQSPRCEEMPFLGSYRANRFFHAQEIVWNYLLPVSVAFVLDSRVMFFNPPRLMAGNITQKSCTCIIDNMIEEASKLNDIARNPKRESQDIGDDIHKRMLSHRNEKSVKAFANCARCRSTVYHWLAITTLNLLLNTPDLLIRLITLFDIFDFDKLNEFLSSSSIIIVARVLYCAQFVVNAAYLTCFVFRESVSLNRVPML